jgi:hypothetical protein
MTHTLCIFYSRMQCCCCTPATCSGCEGPASSLHDSTLLAAARQCHSTCVCCQDLLHHNIIASAAAAAACRCHSTCLHRQDVIQHALTVSAAAADVLPGMGIQLDPEASPAPDGTPAFKAVACNSGNYGIPPGLRTGCGCSPAYSASAVWSLKTSTAATSQVSDIEEGPAVNAAGVPCCRVSACNQGQAQLHHQTA